MNFKRKIYYKSLKDISQQYEQLKNILTIIYHDIKQPLNAINCLTDWILEDRKNVFSDDTCQHLIFLKDRVYQLISFINDLADYTSTADSHYILTDPDKLIRDIQLSLIIPDGFQIIMPDHKVIFKTKKFLLHRILYNLILNSIDHHQNPLHGVVEICIIDKGKYYEFRIKDNGPGIHPKFHKYIFNFSTTLYAKDVKSRSGLGLAIVKKIIDQEQQKIWIKSKEGRGSTFIFTWPKIN